MLDTKGKVLVVDDNHSLCRTMSLVLSRRGYGVTIAQDGMAGVAKIRERPFDIVFLDIRMPVMSGVDVYRAIKEIRPGAVVVMMTAYAVEDLVQEVLREGAYGVVYKPLDIERIIGLVEEAKKMRPALVALVADDDPATLAAVRDTLEAEGHRVSTCATGDEAMGLTRQLAPDVAFVGAGLSTGAGPATHAAIAKENPAVMVVLLMTPGQEEPELAEDLPGNSAYPRLHKPLDIEELQALIDDVISRRSRS